MAKVGPITLEVKPPERPEGAKGCHVRIVIGDPPEDGDYASTQVQAGRYAKCFINGEEIPHLVDIGADFALDGLATVTLGIRAQTIEIEGPSPQLVIERLHKEFGAIISEVRSPTDHHRANERARRQLMLIDLVQRLDNDSLGHLITDAEDRLLDKADMTDASSRSTGPATHISTFGGAAFDEDDTDDGME